jgi:2-polyprenyl-3-methyl-5-hydroxy-6-metoxy-1,4-benzoquinol methylase
LERYKEKLYERYASLMYGKSPIAGEEKELVRSKSYDKTLRGWLPDSEDAAILDIGCGRGNLLKYLRKKGFRNVKGVDISEEQVVLAKQICESVDRGDAIEYLNHYKQCLNLIVGLDVIEHFRKAEVIPFIEGCYEALQPEGRLILQTPNAGSPWGMDIVKGDFTHEVSFTPNSLCKLLELCGFDQIETRGIDPTVHGTLSMARFASWKLIWLLLAVWNLSETGTVGSGIYSRVFLASALRRA